MSDTKITTQILDGKALAKIKQQELIAKTSLFKNKSGRSPKLVVVIVGNDPASQVYVRNKVKACGETGFESELIELPENTDQSVLDKLVHKLNKDDSVDGILVQLPLPKHLDAERINHILDPMKDADGFTFENLGLLFAGQTRVAPCTPYGVIQILRHYGVSIEGKHAVVVGRSLTVGRPMAQLLLQAQATLSICHSKTKNLEDITRLGDIVVVAAGKPEFLGKDAFKRNSVVIDVGIHRIKDSKKLVGDVKANELLGHVTALTPVPGGVGPMTIAMLLENTLILAELRQQRS